MLNTNDIHFAMIRNTATRWRNLALLAPLKKYAQQQAVILAGDLVENLFYLEEGTVRVEYIHSDGREKILHYYGPNSMIGEIYYFLQEPSPIGFICTKPSKFRIFSASMLTQNIFPNHIELLYDMLASLSRKAVLLGNLLTTQALDSIPMQVCYFLYTHTERTPENKLVAKISLSKQEIADLFGVHRVTISKIIKNFIDDGLLQEISRKELLIADEELFFTMLAHSASTAAGTEGKCRRQR